MQRVEEARTALDEQYEALFDDRIDNPEPPRSNDFDVTNIVSQTRGDDAGERRHGRTRSVESVEWALLAVNRRIWRRLPARVRGLHAIQAYGRWLHVSYFSERRPRRCI